MAKRYNKGRKGVIIMKFNEKIAYCRRKAGMSQVDLADALGVSRQAVSKWETGEASPDISKLSKLAEVFDVSADWLISEKDTVVDFANENKTVYVRQAPRSIKPGRAPSAMSAVMSLLGVAFGIFWTYMALRIGAPIFMGIFGVCFTVIIAFNAVASFHNAMGSNRFSLYDIKDEEEEPDPFDDLID